MSKRARTPRDNGVSASEGIETPITKQERLLPKHDLCSNCQEIDFRAGWAKAVSHFSGLQLNDPRRAPGKVILNDKSFVVFHDGLCIQQLDSPLSQPSSCRLCELFRGVRVEAEGSEKRYKLMAYSSTDSAFCSMARLPHDKFLVDIFLAIVPDYPDLAIGDHLHKWIYEDIPASGAIFRSGLEQPPSSHLVMLPRKVPNQVCFNTLKRWDTYCKEYHGPSCSPGIPPGKIERAFRLIDCFQDPADPQEYPWGTPYVALSYVWGNKSDRQMWPWPVTIRDAVTITKQMGRRYLWVDQFCIDQKNIQEVAYLMSKMAAIYQYADFVLIAAAGTNDSYGLPGVGYRARISQPSVSLDHRSTSPSENLICTGPDPRNEIMASCYWQRGWTYQEAVLGTRRLAFTDVQAYWECQCMAVHESLEYPLDVSHVEKENAMVMAGYLRGGIFKGPEFSGGSQLDMSDEGAMILCADMDRDIYFGFEVAQQNPMRSRLRGLAEHIREFTGRDLTDGKDSLKAFDGIGQWYNSPDLKLQLILGIPVYYGPTSGGRSGAQMTFAFSVSSWHHRLPNEGSSFVSEDHIRRRHLPSWTWAGWKGKVSWKMPLRQEHAPIMCEMATGNPPVDKIWAADISLDSDNLGSTSPRCRIRLREATGADYFRSSETMVYLTIHDAWILRFFDITQRVDQHSLQGIDFQHVNEVGRPGEAKIACDRPNWDQHRLEMKHVTNRPKQKGRLVSIFTSEDMTREEWSRRHKTGELLSVLVWAGRTPCTSNVGHPKHGVAKFLTLKKVEKALAGLCSSPSAVPVWERVGCFQFGLVGHPNCELTKYETMEDIIEKWLPVRRYSDGGAKDIVLQ